MSDVPIDPLVALVRELLAGLHDGTVSPEEAGAIFEALAGVLEELAGMLPKWWMKAVMATAATALRQSAEHVGDMDSWPKRGTDGE